jgi:hypothetical protein
MAELNLNFHEQTGRHNPTEKEFCQIEGLAVSVDAIIKTLAVYAEHTNHNREDIGGVCLWVCNALELLMEPVIEYLSNYAGGAPAPEKEADHEI